MNKNGIAMVVVFLILVLLGGAVLLLLTKGLFGTISEDVDDQTQVCKASIAKAFAGSIQCLPDIFDFEFQCKTDLALIDTESKEEVMDKLADELYTCMWYIDRGKNLDKAECQTSISKNYCFDCSVIKFGDKTKKLGSISINEFRNYLREKRVPYSFDGSYYDYLFDADAYLSLDERDDPRNVYMDRIIPGDWEAVTDFNNRDKIDFSKDYIVTYDLFLIYTPPVLHKLVDYPASANFIFLSEEKSDIHNDLVKGCEYLV